LLEILQLIAATGAAHLHMRKRDAKLLVRRVFLALETKVFFRDHKITTRKPPEGRLILRRLSFACGRDALDPHAGARGKVVRR